MEAFRFTTKISKDGIIQIPKNSTFLGQEVELIILPKSDLEDKNNKSKITPLEFVEKWAGILKDADVENAKYDYLMNKYK